MNSEPKFVNFLGVQESIPGLLKSLQIRDLQCNSYMSSYSRAYTSVQYTD
jgi:hypothetical protein